MASLQTQLEAVARLPRDGMVEAARAVERIGREIGASVGPVSLGRKGRRVKLRAVAIGLKASSDSAEVNVYGVPTGPWVWVTSGTRPHTIPKTAARARGKGRKTRYLKGDRYAHPYGQPVHHPGASGKGAWRRVVARAETEVPQVFLDAARRVMAGG